MAIDETVDADESTIETTPPSCVLLIVANCLMAFCAISCADNAVLLMREVSRGIPDVPRASRVSIACCTVYTDILEYYTVDMHDGQK